MGLIASVEGWSPILRDMLLIDLVSSIEGLLWGWCPLSMGCYGVYRIEGYIVMELVASFEGLLWSCALLLRGCYGVDLLLWGFLQGRSPPLRGCYGVGHHILGLLWSWALLLRGCYGVGLCY